MKLPIMLSSPFPSYLVPISPQYSQHPKIMSLRQCDRSSFTPIHNRHDYGSVNFISNTAQDR